MPGDWPDLDVRAHDAFERIVDVFLQRSPDNLWTREADFNLLVDGLAAARATGKVAESVFLTVMSSDPCEHMSNLEERALPLLNPPHIVRRWYGASTSRVATCANSSRDPLRFRTPIKTR